MEAGLESLRIGFIGVGRVASALSLALAGRGLRVEALASRDTPRAQALADRLSGCLVLEPQALAQRCELIFVTTPDDAIATQVQALRWRQGQALLHCSGACGLDVLAAAQREGAQIGAFHPLQIFSDGAAAAERLPGSSVAIEAPDERLRTQLEQLALRLQMKPLLLPEGGRALYHAGAGYAASFVLLMLAEACAAWRELGFSETQALDALLPLAHGSLDAAAQRGVSAALSGPLVRGDAGVVDAHLRAMQDWGPEHLVRYRALAEQQLALLQQAGRLDGEALARLLATLKSR